MKNIFITDTHFGAKNNSISFFEGQLRFFKEQLIPYIKEQNEPVSLYHLGDVFDSRSTLSVHIAFKVKELFSEMERICATVAIIPGNHDFLQQTETNDNYNSPNLILNDLIVVDKCMLLYNKMIMYDWNAFKDLEKVKKHIVSSEIKAIGCHEDIFALPDDFIRFINEHNIKLLSGHIHQAKIKGNLWNLGATCPKDFSDANDPKYAYVFDDDYNLIEKIENKTSVRFWRLNEDAVINFKKELYNKEDKIEIYLPKEKILDGSYEKELEVITSEFKVIIIPVEDVKSNEVSKVQIESFDINKIIEQSIPEDCRELFNKIIKE